VDTAAQFVIYGHWPCLGSKNWDWTPAPGYWTSVLLASVVLSAALRAKGHEILLFSLLAGQGMRYA